ncbi:hypothetical protein GM418_02455 [Maribellus comscasis]|uniref:Uncharacterized protein n=1 Tax=Maribellus comscasis TaxID=2681766 RepID=A0A6I6JQQ3_9BACT|nr:hypothetical protein [Maribellus comscasis]QGY42552.1 hypothetical protein GM418_02455 [Maribellus comscasis]
MAELRKKQNKRGFFELKHKLGKGDIIAIDMVYKLKAHFYTQSGYGKDERKFQYPPLLYNHEIDPSEKYDIADQYPEIIQEMEQILKEHKSGIVPVENQLDKF